MKSPRLTLPFQVVAVIFLVGLVAAYYENTIPENTLYAVHMTCEWLVWIDIALGCVRLFRTTPK